MPAYFWARGGAVERSTGISWNIYTGNVFDPHGAGLGTVALPQLKPVGAVDCGEVDGVAEDGAAEGPIAARHGIDPVHPHAAGREERREDDEAQAQEGIAQCICRCHRLTSLVVGRVETQ